MVAALSTSTSLESLYLGFQSPLSRPDRESQHPPPLTRSVPLVPTFLCFKGDSEYINDLVARIDASRLGNLNMTFFNQIVFETPQFLQFISRTPSLKDFEEAHLDFVGDTASVGLSSQTSGSEVLEVKVRGIELDWQVSSMEQVSNYLPPLSTLEDLYIEIEALYWHLDRRENIESALWLKLLRPFSAVKNLYLSKEIAPRIAPAPQELVMGRTTKALPTLQNISFRDSSHRDLPRKASRSSLPRSRTAWPLAAGKEIGRNMTINSYTGFPNITMV